MIVLSTVQAVIALLLAIGSVAGAAWTMGRNANATKTLATSIESLAGALKEGLTKIDGRLDGHADRLRRHDTDIVRLDTATTKQSERIGEIGPRLHELGQIVNKHMGATDAALNALDGRVERLEIA